MNETPTPPTTPPVFQPSPQVVQAPLAPHSSQTLSIWSLILGISALALAIIFFISIPAAIVAIILGIMVLAKHRPGRGKAIAGIVTGGIALLVIPFLLTITIVSYNAVTDKAHEVQKTADQRAANKLSSSSSSDTAVNTACFTYTVPAGYENKSDASKGCATSVNMPDGDALTSITVKANVGTIGSLDDVVTTFNKALRNGNAGSPGVIDQDQLTFNGHTAYYVSYKDANGLLFGNYIILDSNANRVDETGKAITAYTVAGYVYNSTLKDLVKGVADSLIIK